MLDHRRVAPMGQALRVAALLAAVVAAGSTEADPVRSPVLPWVPTVAPHDTVHRTVSEYGPDTLLVRELAFDGPVVSAQIDDSSGILLVAIASNVVVDQRSLFGAGTGQARLLAYDLQNHQIVWSKASTLVPVRAQGKRAILRKGAGPSSLISVEDGHELAKIDGNPLIWPDSVALAVGEKELGRWDLETGEDLWRAHLEIGGNIDDVIRRDSVAYVVADGIEKFDLRDGRLWSYSAPASRKNLYADGFGQTVQIPGLYGGSRATSLVASPLILDDAIFFAADTTVIKLDPGTGRARWRRHLTRPRGFSLNQLAFGSPTTPEFLGRLVLRDANRNVLVASMGWASGPKYDLVADRPSVALLAKNDGDLVARAQVPGVTFLNDVVTTPFGTYVMSYDRVLVLDDALIVRATWVAPEDLRPLGQFISAGDDAVVLTTGSGLVALSSDSLLVAWSGRFGRMLAVSGDNVHAVARYCVTTQGIVRLDKRASLRPDEYYPVRGSLAELRNGWLLMRAGTKVRLVTILNRDYTTTRD